MQTPAVVFHVWPALLHSVGDVYIESGRSVGEAPVMVTAGAAHPATSPRKIRARVTAFMGSSWSSKCRAPDTSPSIAPGELALVLESTGGPGGPRAAPQNAVLRSWRRGTRQTMPPAGRRDYMQTPEIRSQVRPELSHSLFVVYERGEAPGYDVSYDSWLAQPAMNPTTTRTKARVFMGSPPVGGWS
jgi:hypothetical protein